MSRSLADSPLFMRLASLAASLYASKNIFLDNDALVIFTCGASKHSKSSAREQLLDYANKYFKHGTLFRAEDAFSVLLRSNKDDLLTIEHSLADYSDCVVIINESAGTLAELGAFASNEAVVKKLLIVNPSEHRDALSFINLGPIAKTDRKSKFSKTIHIDLASASLHFDTVLNRIESNAVRKRRRGVDFSKTDSWKSSEGKLRLLLIQDILNLFSPVNYYEVLCILKACFPSEYVRFNVELGLLVATRKVIEEGELLLTTPDCSQHSYEVDHSTWLYLRKKIIDVYRSKDRERLNYLTKRAWGVR